MPINHTVVFRLRHASGSEEEARFIRDARETLTSIPGVAEFTVSRQISQKSDTTFQFAMTFDGQKAYDAYNTHPDHVAFVASRWEPEVASFQEYDFVNY